jgi:Glu-tRNA(Gln) amidotransferase subunit E-like FAD-binding protein
MGETREADDFINGFENLSKDEQKEIIKKLMPKFCEIAMKDKTVIQEMMPECLEMMKGADFPMKEMMSNMMGKKF